MRLNMVPSSKRVLTARCDVGPARTKSVSVPTFRKGVRSTKALHPLTRAVRRAVRVGTLKGGECAEVIDRADLGSHALRAPKDPLSYLLMAGIHLVLQNILRNTCGVKRRPFKVRRSKMQGKFSNKESGTHAPCRELSRTKRLHSVGFVLGGLTR